jgi:hypothetical protein
MDIIKTTVPRRGLHLSIVIALTSSLLSFVAPAKASTPTLIYDFQATGYNATTGQWPNTGSISETVTVSKKNVGTPNPVKDSEPNSVAFVGSNEHEFITTAGSSWAGTKAFSLAVWFKTSTTGRKILAFESSSNKTVSGGYDRMLWVGGDGKLYFGTYSNNVIKSSERVDNNNWQYAVATFSGSESKLYLNGTEVATDPSGAASTFIGYWRVGGYQAAGAWGNVENGSLQSGYFTGSIGQVSIYESLLTPTQVSTEHSITRSTYRGLTPTFDTATPTADGFTVQITNYDAAYTWTGTATASGSVSISNTGLVTVTGVAPSTSSTATITTSRADYSNRTATVSGTSSTGAALNPTFGSTTATTDGFTASITNYDAAFTWTTPTVDSGSVAITSTTGATRVLTVTGLSPGASATITQNTSRTGYSNGTATVTGSARAQTTAADNSAAQAEAARKAREQQDLINILALIPKIGELTLSLGETTKALYSTKCVKGKTTKYVNKGSKCPKGYAKKK